MKSFDLLSQRIEVWRKSIFPHYPSCSLNRAQGKGQTKGIKKAHNPLMLTIAIVSLTSIVGYRDLNQPKLDVGTRSPQTIYAPEDGAFEDKKTTEEKRRAIRTGIIPTLKLNQDTNQQIKQELTQLLQEVDSLREQVGVFPWIDPQVVSLPTQRYLRQCQESAWQTVLANLKTEASTSGAEQFNSNINIEKASNELKIYQQQVSASEFAAFLDKINLTRQNYAAVWELLSKQGINLETDYRAIFLQIPDKVWWQTRSGLIQVMDEILSQGIPPGLPPSILETTIEIHLSPEVPALTAPLAIDLLKAIIRPNLTEDRTQTKSRAEQAAQAVKPVIVTINQGELIVAAGEIISQENFVVLDGFGLSRRGINWLGLGISALVVTGAVTIFAVVIRFVYRPMRCRDHWLLLFLSISTPLLAVANIPYNNLPAVGLLVSSFYSPTIALTQVSLLTGLMGFSPGILNWESLVVGAAGGGLVAAVMAGRLHSREELAMLGGTIGLTQGAVYLIVNLILSAAAGTIWNVLLPEAVFYGFSGVAWVVVALGISPYLERLFDLVTPIRLAELSNPNRPLLKRLALEAPGTFQHTMFVASLAEAAARELHANVELIRAGTLYHDIGKTHDPLGFIENQMGGPNKHEQINDPWESALIIKKHVSEGLVMARKYGLPKAIRDFIPEHQGTLLISYFYFQAKNRSQQENRSVLESDFRYDGPIPQSRETGIVMLADACEAALRSLKDATSQQAISMVKKIFKARWQDGQLADSGLRFEELPTIAEVFVRVWQQYNHERITYPQEALEPGK